MDFTSLLQNLTQFLPSENSSPKSPYAKTLFIISAHPDDECIQGGIALRLMQENNFHVVNIAVTLGSDVKRQKARQKELEKATDFLGFENIVLSEDWKLKEKELASLISKYQPSVILCHHEEDHHPTHIKCAKLLHKVCSKNEFSEPFMILWNEFWGQLKAPQVLIEIPVDLLEKQMSALELHVGEVKRNPYHLRLPAWMMDNVRRGAEVIAGKGSKAPAFAFGVLVMIAFYHKKKIIKKKTNIPSVIKAKDDLYRILSAASLSKTRRKS